MDALIEWINNHPDWVRSINKAYRHQIVNNILMAAYSIGTLSLLIFTINTFRDKAKSNWLAAVLCIAFIGLAVGAVLLFIDRSNYYQSWDMAMM